MDLKTIDLMTKVNYLTNIYYLKAVFLILILLKIKGMENQKHFGDNLIAAIKKAAVELEAAQVQAALGKAEAVDKAEELKNKFKGLIQDAKNKAYLQESKFEKLKGKLEHLEVQLALGKAEAKEVIEEQRKKISGTIHEIEAFFAKL